MFHLKFNTQTKNIENVLLKLAIGKFKEDKIKQKEIIKVSVFVDEDKKDIAIKKAEKMCLEILGITPPFTEIKYLGKFKSTLDFPFFFY